MWKQERVWIMLNNTKKSKLEMWSIQFYLFYLLFYFIILVKL